MHCPALAVTIWLGLALLAAADDADERKKLVGIWQGAVIMGDADKPGDPIVKQRMARLLEHGSSAELEECRRLPASPPDAPPWRWPRSRLEKNPSGRIVSGDSASVKQRQL